jgi:hypothetical protein
LGTGNTRHFRKSIVNNLLIFGIIYKFTQGNLGAKKIASQDKKTQIATLTTDSAIPEYSFVQA